ncbi:MAG: SDR family NAD(P)-dependent oxidoreductase [Granulosicoccus sp.]|nr:SDR family NAD(P)-dependent oxidoreductase [Granulosicoccus sp.]
MKKRQIVWIVGASSGIGRELTLQYADQGSTVYASARGVEKLQQLVNDTRNAAGTVVAAPLDVQNNDSIEQFVASRVQQGDIPDLCIFNAGYYDAIGIEDLTLENFERTVDVNYMGVVRCLMAILPHYRKQRAGHLAIVSSVAGYAGLPRAAAYGSTKAALINLCESMYAECRRDGINMSVINPGFVRTPMTEKNTFDMPFIIEPDAAATHIVKGLSENRFEIHFPKRFTLIMKLFGILPYRLYFFLTSRLLK